MQLGVIADDFTGASDIANTLAKGGLCTTQFLGTPLDNSPVHCEAGVVALKTRSIAARVAIALSLEALDWLKRQGCLQFVFKYCSTFDSTPEGNIGPVGEALAKALNVRGVPVCPAFPTTGRTVLSRLSLCRRPAAQRIRDGEPSTQSDDRREYPPVAREAI
jgi:uncharacterized protein YgbK (DUF1537 family)